MHHKKIGGRFLQELMLVKIEARILIFPGTDFHYPSTSVPPGTFFRLCPWLGAILIGAGGVVPQVGGVGGC